MAKRKYNPKRPNPEVKFYRELWEEHGPSSLTISDEQIWSILNLYGIREAKPDEFPAVTARADAAVLVCMKETAENWIKMCTVLGPTPEELIRYIEDHLVKATKLLQEVKTMLEKE